MKFILGTIEENGKRLIQSFSRKRLQPQTAGISSPIVHIKETEKKKKERGQTQERLRPGHSCYNKIRQRQKESALYFEQ